MIKVGIVGGTGYTGVELLRLLAQHRDVELVAITSRGDAGTAVSTMFPSLRGRVGLNFEDPAVADLKSCDVVFFATPHGVAMDRLPEGSYDRRAAMASVPPLIKAYLRLGGFVGEGAWVDHQFNTTDVCLVMDTARMSERQINYARSIGAEADLIREGASERERMVTMEALRVLRRTK